MDSRAEVTRYLQDAREGRPAGTARLYELVYRELRSIAGAKMRGELDRHTLQPTALVHETFLKLVGDGNDFQSRAHFFSAAARAMREILVDHARSRRAEKRGGGHARVTVVDFEATKNESLDDLITLDEILTKFEVEEPRKARVVELRFFCGLGVEEVARILEVSTRTVILDWNFAKAWLYRELSTRNS